MTNEEVLKTAEENCTFMDAITVRHGKTSSHALRYSDLCNTIIENGGKVNYRVLNSYIGQNKNDAKIKTV